MSEGTLIGTGGQFRLWRIGSFMSFDKSDKFKASKKCNLGLAVDWYWGVWGEEVLAPVFPKARLGLTPTTNCDELEMFWNGFHPKAKGLLTWGVLYFVRLNLDVARVIDTGVVISPLKNEKGELLSAVDKLD